MVPFPIQRVALTWSPFPLAFGHEPGCLTSLCVPGSGAVFGHLLHTAPAAGQKQRRGVGVLPQLPEVLPHGDVGLCM